MVNGLWVNDRTGGPPPNSRRHNKPLSTRTNTHSHHAYSTCTHSPLEGRHEINRNTSKRPASCPVIGHSLHLPLLQNNKSRTQISVKLDERLKSASGSDSPLPGSCQSKANTKIKCLNGAFGVTAATRAASVRLGRVCWTDATTFFLQHFSPIVFLLQVQGEKQKNLSTGATAELSK